MADAQIWAVSDGAAGNRRQADALAAALAAPDQPVRSIDLATRAPWRWLAPRLAAGAERAFAAEVSDALQDAPPRLLIGCGRQAALAARVARARGSRVVQILDPRIDPAHFDALVVPQHDGVDGANVIATLGALNAVDAAWLARARLSWARLSQLPSPRTVLLLGGPHRSVQIDRRWFAEMAAILQHWLQRDGGSLLVSSSRRTPDWLRAAARKEFANLPGLQWHGEADGDNPYEGLLAWGERFVVSPDSTNLLSEACATGAPVLTHVRKPATGKLGRLHRALLETGRLRPLRLAYRPWEYEPLRELDRVVRELRRRGVLE